MFLHPPLQKSFRSRFIGLKIARLTYLFFACWECLSLTAEIVRPFQRLWSQKMDIEEIGIPRILTMDFDQGGLMIAKYANLTTCYFVTPFGQVTQSRPFFNTEVTTVSALPDGSFALGGADYSPNEQHHSRAIVFWLGADGSELRRVGFRGQPQLGQGEAFWHVQPRANGGYLLVGGSSTSTGADKQARHYGSSDGWVVAIDAEGNKQWDQSYGGVDRDYLEWGFELPDKTLFLVGYSEWTAHGSTMPSQTGLLYQWIVKTDESGTIQLAKRLFPSLTFSCIRTRNDEFVLGGHGIITRVTSSGVVRWNHVLKGPQYIIVPSMVELSDGRIVASVEQTDSVRPAQRDFRCFDQSGNLLWQTRKTPGFLTTTGPLFCVDERDSSMLVVNRGAGGVFLEKFAGDSVSAINEGVACFALPDRAT